MTQIEQSALVANVQGFLDRVLEGESFVICRGCEPIAEIRPVPKKSSEPRPLGLGKGLGTIHSSFFDPLPEELLDAFEGKGR